MQSAGDANDVTTITQRLGRAKQRCAQAAQHCAVEVAKDATGTLVSAITWTQRVKPGTAANLWKTDPGVYCLRTTLVEQDNATQWRSYTMLTNLESLFRSLKTDLGLRPTLAARTACWSSARSQRLPWQRVGLHKSSAIRAKLRL